MKRISVLRAFPPGPGSGLVGAVVAFGSFIFLLLLTNGPVLGAVPTPQEMRGPFPIMSTTYFEDGSIDYEGLKRQLKWVDESGCPGVIWCQSNDAIDLLTTEEKLRGFEACAQAPNGDIYVHYDRDRGGAAEILFAKFREDDVQAGKLVSKDSSLKNIVKNRQLGMNRGGANAPTTSNE